MGWELNGLTFTDSIVSEPDSDGVSVYSHSHRFTMDYSKPLGQQWGIEGGESRGWGIEGTHHFGFLVAAWRKQSSPRKRSRRGFLE